MNRPLTYILLANLAVAVALVFMFAHLMVSPGSLIEGHRELEQDCFACHVSFVGVQPNKCVACHKVADIGILTSKGLPVLTQKAKTPFHQKLGGQECVACHSDHQGVSIYRIRQRFSHGLLASDDQKQCVTCHKKPVDKLHRSASETCSLCHVTEKWKPASFKHEQLALAERELCTNCHQGKAPNDAMHNQTSSKCGTCHTTEQWKPASFEHAKFFVLDDQHKRCTTCHRTKDYKQYTCYFCHEHSPERTLREHRELGMSSYENCVACHRSTDEHEAKRAWESLRRGVPYLFEQVPGGRRKSKED
ncbi:MAG: class III cytochrome C family protein [Alphaproteobacteria bacterium]|nr:class III cytochrome C family protein [Alphaproteobacteria bacterium]